MLDDEDVVLFLIFRRRKNKTTNTKKVWGKNRKKSLKIIADFVNNIFKTKIRLYDTHLKD